MNAHRRRTKPVRTNNRAHLRARIRRGNNTYIRVGVLEWIWRDFGSGASIQHVEDYSRCSMAIAHLPPNHSHVRIAERWRYRAQRITIARPQHQHEDGVQQGCASRAAPRRESDHVLGALPCARGGNALGGLISDVGCTWSGA